MYLLPYSPTSGVSNLHLTEPSQRLWPIHMYPLVCRHLSNTITAHLRSGNYVVSKWRWWVSVDPVTFDMGAIIAEWNSWLLWVVDLTILWKLNSMTILWKLSSITRKKKLNIVYSMGRTLCNGGLCAIQYQAKVCVYVCTFLFFGKSSLNKVYICFFYM